MSSLSPIVSRAWRSLAVGCLLLAAVSAGGGDVPLRERDIVSGPARVDTGKAVVEFWVPNSVTNEVLGFDPMADGDTPPVRTIGGERTQLNNPSGVAVDRQGWIYVTNVDDNSLTVYPPEANGNTPPARVVRGPSTGLASPSGVAVDASGAVYVANPVRDRVTVYAPGANGDVWPERSIWGSRTGIRYPLGIAVDDTGAVYVASYYERRISVFPPGADENARPALSIQVRYHFKPQTGSLSAVAVGRDGRIYATSGDYEGAIVVFGPGASGMVEPVRAIGGKRESSGIPYWITLDRRGRVAALNWGPGRQMALTVYDTTASGDAVQFRKIAGPATRLTWPPRDSTRLPLPPQPAELPSVTVFRPGVAGNTPPDRSIKGNSTLMVAPVNIAVTPDGRIYVLSCQGRVTTYAEDVNGDAPPVRLPTGPGLEPSGAFGLALGGADTVFVGVAGRRRMRAGRVHIYTSLSPQPDTTVTGLASWWSSGLARHPDGRLYRGSARGYEAIDLEILGEPRIQTLTGRAGETAGDETGLLSPGLFAFDSRGNLFVPNRDDAVRVYDAKPTDDLRPRRKLHGRRTRLDDPVAVAIGPGDTIFVANAGGMYSKSSVTVYPPGASGDAEPVRVIQGDRSGLEAVKAMAVDSEGTLYVLNNPAGVDGCLPRFGF